MTKQDNIVNILFRVGLILIMCTLLIGLIFSQWTPILILGITFVLPDITRRLIQNYGGHVKQEKLAPDEITLMQHIQEEI